MDPLPLKDFNLITETENPANKITFQWSIRNINKLPGLIRSSKFSLVSGQLPEWDVRVCRELDNEFQFSLAYHAPKTTDPIKVRSNSRFLLSKGSELERYHQSANVFYGGDQHPLFTRVKLPVSEDDKLVFLCSIEVHGYGVVSNRNIYNDHRDIEELKSDFLSMMESGEFADVKIQIAKRYFSAHSCVLKHRAPKLFSHIQEVTKKGWQFSLSDVEPDMFTDVLQYIYGGKVNQMAIALDFEKCYIMAAQYDLKSLLRSITREIMNSMTTDNVCEFYQMAEKNNHEELKSYCEAFIRANPSEFESNYDYLKFSATRPHLPYCNNQDLSMAFMEPLLEEDYVIM